MKFTDTRSMNVNFMSPIADSTKILGKIYRRDYVGKSILEETFNIKFRKIYLMILKF